MDFKYHVEIAVLFSTDSKDTCFVMIEMKKIMELFFHP
jgi:hypothetical protein